MGVTRVLMVFTILILNEVTKGVSEDGEEKGASTDLWGVEIF